MHLNSARRKAVSKLMFEMETYSGSPTTLHYTDWERGLEKLKKAVPMICHWQYADMTCKDQQWYRRVCYGCAYLMVIESSVPPAWEPCGNFLSFPVRWAADTRCMKRINHFNSLLRRNDYINKNCWVDTHYLRIQLTRRDDLTEEIDIILYVYAFLWRRPHYVSWNHKSENWFSIAFSTESC